MGASLGNPIDEEKQAKINDTIQDVVKKFTFDFAKEYTQAVVEEIKSEIEPESSYEDELKLQKAPIPSHVLKTGMLVKRGETVKNWKSRFFIAYNEKDNFKIDYHDGTNETGKLKGSILCAGYRAYEFNSDDIDDLGEPGIKLVPWSSRRRTWYIKCPDDAERKEWLSVFENACYKAKPPHHEDECIANAFDATLQKLRNHYWFWGYYCDAGSEGERLAEFLLDLLDRDILNEVYDSIPDSPAKNLAIDTIKKTVNTSVKAACSSAWISASASVQSTSSNIKDSAKQLIDPLLKKQSDIKERIVEKISGTVDPFLADKASSLLRPILNVIFKPVIDAFSRAAKGFHSHIASKIASNEFQASKFSSTITMTDWQMDWWNGPIHKAYHVIEKLYTNDMASVATLLAGGITPYTIYNMLMDRVKLIIHRAVFTFGSLAKSVGESELTSVLSHVTSLLFHDCVISAKSIMIDILKAILDAPLQENVIAPSGDLVAPIQDMIEAIPIPGLSMLMDLPSMVEDVVYSIEENALDAMIGKSMADIKSSFDVASAELGISSLSTH